MRNIFNPFDKDFGEVREEDLNILKSVAEGWYIEYKREKMSGKSIAKSISSFANSHGGIYLVGIESDPANNCAKEILGVSDSPDVVRDSVRGNLQPFPYFETFTVELTNGKRVVMAVVPEGNNPPYIHSDGRIYRRQGAASDPVQESDRSTIDRLYRKAQKLEEELEGFRKFDLSFCRAEEDIPYLEIFINTTPYKHFFIEDSWDKENLISLLNQFSEPFSLEEDIEGFKISSTGNMKLDSVNTYHNSIALRVLRDQDLALNGMTLLIDFFGNLKALFPLDEEDSMEDFLLDRSDDRSRRYLHVLNRSRGSMSSLGFLRPKQIMGAIFGVLPNYASYLDSKGYKEAFEVKLRLKNFWRKTIYIESERFVEHIEASGIPVCMKSEQYFPSNPITYTISEIRDYPIRKCLGIFSCVATAMGIPFDVALESVLEEMHKNPHESGA